ncbi:hypothetical protein D3C71_1915500 [compost metagenome]
MQGKNAAEPGDFFHSLEQGVIIHLAEPSFPFASGIGDERLEAGNTGFRQLLQILQIAGHQPAPQHIIHGGVAGRCLCLELQRSFIHCRRIAVQGHIRITGAASGGKRC